MTESSGILQCLVVDDDAVLREQLSAFVGAHDRLSLAASCASAVEADNWLRTNACDVIFLDIEMPMMSGLELVRHLEVRPQIVLVTGKAEYAVEAFDVDVADYLLKPVSYARFAKAVQRVERALEAEKEKSAPAAQSGATPDRDGDGETFFVRSEGRLVKLDLTLVTHVEAQRDYMMIHEGGRKLLVHGTMKSMADRLPSKYFVRVHRSYLVRVAAIEDVEDGSIVVGRNVIPIGASYRAALMERLQTL